MREIKFRAWDVKEKAISETWPIQFVPNFYLSYFINPDPTFKDRMVLMQFTNLHDKNGKKIYEGDILSSDQYPFQGDGGHNYAAEVIFEDGAFHAVLSLTPGGAERVNGVAEGNSTSGDGMSELEVIGNIYENPELLK